MKKLILIILALGFTFSSSAQEKVKPKDLLGVWKFIIDVDEEVRDDLEDDLEDENFFIASFAKAVAGFALDIVEDIDIRFEFEEDGKLRSYVSVLNEEERDRSEWHINEYGGLVFDADVSVDDWDDGAWYFVDDVLVPCDRKGRKIETNKVYMVRID